MKIVGTITLQLKFILNNFQTDRTLIPQLKITDRKHCVDYQRSIGLVVPVQGCRHNTVLFSQVRR